MINVFEFDSQTNQIVNVLHYKMNIDEANKGAEPHWSLSYDFLKTYPIVGEAGFMSFDSMDALANSFNSTDSESLKDYVWNFDS